MREISSKKYSSRNKVARKFNSIYFNEGSSRVCNSCSWFCHNGNHFLHCVSTFPTFL
uniref:Rpd3 n=1 Tax=Arundo donax TaxID=35708 RepID=A0A0A9GKA2_ARUDO